MALNFQLSATFAPYAEVVEAAHANGWKGGARTNLVITSNNPTIAPNYRGPAFRTAVITPCEEGWKATFTWSDSTKTEGDVMVIGEKSSSYERGSMGVSRVRENLSDAIAIAEAFVISDGYEVE
jgi:hypothetical protein